MPDCSAALTVQICVGAPRCSLSERAASLASPVPPGGSRRSTGADSHRSWSRADSELGEHPQVHPHKKAAKSKYAAASMQGELRTCACLRCLAPDLPLPSLYVSHTRVLADAEHEGSVEVHELPSDDDLDSHLAAAVAAAGKPVRGSPACSAMYEPAAVIETMATCSSR